MACLMELQEDLQLSCPLRGCGWRTEHSSCVPKLVSHQAAAAPRCSSELSIAALQFLRCCWGLALHQNLHNFQENGYEPHSKWRPAGGQLQVCESEEGTPSISQFHIPLRGSTDGAMHSLLPAPQTAQVVSTLGMWGDTQ